jgi:hypothetical protein
MKKKQELIRKPGNQEGVLEETYPNFLSYPGFLVSEFIFS